MGLRSVRRRRARATASETLGIVLFALLLLGAGLVANAPTNDPRLSVIYTSDEEGQPLERPPQATPDSILPAVPAERPDLRTLSGAVEPSAPLPVSRVADAAPLGVPATRAPPQS